MLGICQVLVPRVQVDLVYLQGAGVTVAEVSWVKKYMLLSSPACTVYHTLTM